MLFPDLSLNSTSNAWYWWAAQETFGRDYVRKSGSKKYQRERWHLRALHEERFLREVAYALNYRLWKHYRQPVQVGVDSVWIDQTPQATAEYLTPTGRSQTVKCELADLLVVTMTGFGGKKPHAKDIQAVLLQAKVTGTPGVLETDASPSSSFKERNLLERCHSNIQLNEGTGTSKSLGSFNLHCSKNLGLASFAKYLTIPKVLLTDAYPYQSMWPMARSMRDGNAYSLGKALQGMVGLTRHRTMGCALDGPRVPSDWQRLVQVLTGSYLSDTVNRFTKTGERPFPRVVQVTYTSSFEMQQELGADSWMLSKDLPWRGGGGRDGGAGDAIHPQENDGGAKMPILLIRANVGRKGYEPPNDEGNRVVG